MTINGNLTLRLPTAPRTAMTLRPYQTEAIERIRGLIRQGRKRILVVAPTGAGKTICFSDIACRTVEKGGEVLILAHRRELVTQSVQKIVGPPHLGGCGMPRELVGVMMGNDKRRNVSAPIQVASIDTLGARLAAAGLVSGRAPTAAELGWPNPRKIVIDEAHRALSPRYAAVLALYPDAIVTGWTATPYRMDGRGLGDLFEDIVIVSDVETLILNGYLVRSRSYSHKVKADLSGVNTASNGDYDKTELAAAVDRDVLVGNIVDHWLTHSGLARTLVFGASVAHSRHIAERFNAQGVPAEHVDGETDPAVRERALDRLRRGELLVLCNYGLFSDGTDVPWVKCVVLARPTKSKALSMQAIGRGMRAIPGIAEVRHLIVIDHAGCVLRHGRPEEPQTFTLEGRARRGDADAVMTKECGGCYALIARGLRECPSCGWLFGEEPGERRGPREEDGELAEVVVSETKRRRELCASIDRVARELEKARDWRAGKVREAVAVEFGKTRRDMDMLELKQVQRWLTDGLFAKQYPAPDDLWRGVDRRTGERDE